MHLYNYFRSSAAYRLRIALNLKNVSYSETSIHLTKDGGHQNKPDFRAINPQGRLPALRLDEGDVLTQSMAIIEYLEETVPQPPLLPQDPLARAKVRSFANIIACDIHPLNNLAPLQYLKRELKQEQEAIDGWYRHWVTEGFRALEASIGPSPYCFGATVTMADVCLAPQMFNARRLKTPLDEFPKLVAADKQLETIPAFEKAKPENQPDAE